MSFEHWLKQGLHLIDFTSSVGNWSQHLTVNLKLKCFLTENIISLPYRLSPCRHKENFIPFLFTEFSKITAARDSHLHSVFLFPKLHSPYTMLPDLWSFLLSSGFVPLCQLFSWRVVRKTWSDTAHSPTWSCIQNYFKCLLPVKHATCRLFFIAVWPLWGVTEANLLNLNCSEEVTRMESVMAPQQRDSKTVV